MENTETFIDRLQWAIARKQAMDGAHGATVARITQAKIAKIAEVSTSAVNYWFKGVNGANAVQSRKLADFLEVDAIWLETGEGQPLPIIAAPRQSRVQEFRAALDDGMEFAHFMAVFRVADEDGRKEIRSAFRLVAERMGLDRMTFDYSQRGG